MSNGTHIINLGNYNAPKVNESNSQYPWVTWDKEGERGKNTFFQYLFDRKDGSVTNGAVINSISKILFGRGLNSETFNELFNPNHQRRLIMDFKVTGMCAVEVVYQGGRQRIAEVNHIPIQMLAPEKINANGVIDAYYFATDWTKVRTVADTERIVSFESKERGGKEIIYLRPYSQGNRYFSKPDYIQGIQYAELEEEIANYHINNIQNGLAPSMLVNLNNGRPANEDTEEQIVKKIERKFQGSSNAGKIVVQFNESKEKEATINPIPLSDASEQYTFLSQESGRKIITAHSVTSPLLMGISTITGLGSNADELRTASVLFENYVVNPMRREIISIYNTINEFNNVTEELEYISLNPFEEEEQEEEDVQGDVLEEEENEQVNASNECCLSSDDHLTEDMANILIDSADEINLDEWEEIAEYEVNHDDDDQDFSNLIKPKKWYDKILLQVRTGIARPNARSEQDNDDVVIRYRYAGNTSPQRPFCRAMMSADKRYRKEDIIQMENQTVNPGWGPNGTDRYSIWLHAGGGNCYHKWNRVIYLRRGASVDVRSPLAQIISRTEARRRGFDVPTNSAPEERRTAAQGVAPINQKNKGFLNPR